MEGLSLGGGMICPGCGKENDDDWVLEIDGKILDGCCQDCWEAACDASWWEMIEALNRAGITS